MLKKIFAVFARDVRVNSRDFLALYIFLFPILFGLLINLLTPSINDTTVNLILLEGDDPEMAAYYEDFAKITFVKDMNAVENRLQKRDDIVAILPDESTGEYYILSQGNEPESSVEAAKLLKTYYEEDYLISESTAELIEFGRTVPPIKKMLVNLSILFTSVLGGMMIAINIVEEKVDNTISAVNVSTISRLGFIMGKSLIGISLPVYGSLVLIWMTGFGGVNVGMVLVSVVASTLLSLLVGFIEGINNDDVINAAAGIKMLFLPMGAAIAAFELLSDKWQMLFYWLPFYWSYRGNDAVLSFSATWPQILLYTGIVLLLCLAVYVYLAPKIKNGLK